MSRDSERLPWCDTCWDNPATWTALDRDGDRIDLCGECYDPAEMIEFSPIGGDTR